MAPQKVPVLSGRCGNSQTVEIRELWLSIFPPVRHWAGLPVTQAQCLLTWTFGYRVWIKGYLWQAWVRAKIRMQGFTFPHPVRCHCLCRNKRLHPQTSVGGLSAYVVSLYCGERLLSSQFHLFSKKTNLNCSSEGISQTPQMRWQACHRMSPQRWF